MHQYWQDRPLLGGVSDVIYARDKICGRRGASDCRVVDARAAPKTSLRRREVGDTNGFEEVPSFVDLVSDPPPFVDPMSAP